MRNRTPVARLRWAFMPWWAHAWRFRHDFDGAVPSRWWERSIGSTTWWLDKLLDRLPGGALFPPMPLVECTCDECRAAVLGEVADAG